GVVTSCAEVMLAERTVTNDYELCFALFAAHALERIDERGESVARVETAEEENGWNVAAQARRHRRVRIEEVDVDSVRNDGPVGLEIAVQRDGGRVRYRDRDFEHVEPALKILAAELVSERLVEVGVEGADGGTIGFLYRQHGKDRAQRRVDVNDVVASLLEDPAHVLAERHADRDPRLRAIGVDRLASADPDDAVLSDGTRKIGRYDVHVMAKFSSFTRKKMDVLAD